MREALRDALINRGGVDPTMLTHAEAVHAQQGGSFAVALMRTGADPLRLLDAFCLVSGLPPAPSTHVRRPTPTSLDGLDEPLCRRFFAVPFDTAADGRLRIAFADPEAAEDAKTLGWPDHVAYLAQPTVVREGLDALFAAHKTSTAPPADLPSVDAQGWTVYDAGANTADAPPSGQVEPQTPPPPAPAAPAGRYTPPPWAVGVGGGPAASPSWADAVEAATLEPAALPATQENAPKQEERTEQTEQAERTEHAAPEAHTSSAVTDEAAVEAPALTDTLALDDAPGRSANDNVELPSDAAPTAAPTAAPAAAVEAEPAAPTPAEGPQVAGGQGPVPASTFDDTTPPTVQLPAASDALAALLIDAAASVDGVEPPHDGAAPGPDSSDPALAAVDVDVLSEEGAPLLDAASADDSEDISIDLASDEGPAISASDTPAVDGGAPAAAHKPLVTDVRPVAVRAPDDERPAAAGQPSGRILGPELDPALPAPHETSTARRRPNPRSTAPTRLDRRAPPRRQASTGALEVVLVLAALVLVGVLVSRADEEEPPAPERRATTVADARVRMQLVRAQQKLDQGEPLAALPVADAVLKASPSALDRAEALLVRGRAWTALKDGPRAHADLRDAMATAPDTEVAGRAQEALHMLILPDGPPPEDRSAAAAAPAPEEEEEEADPWP